MALSVVKKTRSKTKPYAAEDWRVRAARREAQRQRRIERDAAAFERHIARYRQRITDSPHIPGPEKRRLSQMSDSELAMHLAERHQRDKLEKPTRRDPHQNKPWLPGYDSLYL
jgi:hypothetical protein